MIVGRLHPDGALTDMRHAPAPGAGEVELEAMPETLEAVVGVEVSPGLYRAVPRDSAEDQFERVARARVTPRVVLALGRVLQARLLGETPPAWARQVLGQLVDGVP